MTELGLTESNNGDEKPVTVRRWIVILAASLLAPPCIAVGTNLYGLNVRVSALETTPESPKVHDLEMELRNVKEYIKLYETIRPQRERELAELQADRKNTKETMDQMRTEINGKLDRLIFGQRR